MKRTPPNLTALAVSWHAFPSPPLFDGACIGLRLVALQPGKKAQGSWIYRYRTKEGRLRQIKLGVHPAINLAEARKAWGRQKGIRDDPERADPRQHLEHLKSARVAEAAAFRQRAYTVAALCRRHLAGAPSSKEQNTKYLALGWPGAEDLVPRPETPGSRARHRGQCGLRRVGCEN